MIPTSTPPIPVIIYSADLTINPGWTTESDWAFGLPTGGGGILPTPPQSGGNPDPTSGYTGNNVYGYNLDGNYPDSMPNTYYLTTTLMDCSAYEEVKLYFWRWLNVERREHDKAYIHASSDGVNWSVIWENNYDLPTYTTDSYWTRYTYALSPVADNQPNVRVRWGMGPTDTINVFSGWNIDDIEIWGIPIVPGTPTPVPTISPVPTPSATPTIKLPPTPSPTISPVPTSTPPPTASPTITPIPTASPSPSITPSPSQTPTTTPTITPVPTTTPGEPILIYSFSLNSDPGWATQSAWAYGRPLGMGGNGWSFPDPAAGHTGPNVYGFNLAGNYGDNMPAYYLTTTAIDCSDLVKTRLKFWRWLNVETNAYDLTTVQVSNNAVFWTDIWKNPGHDWTTDSSWHQCDYNIASTADAKSSVYIRWMMGPTDQSANTSGWNIDDIEIWGVPAGVTPEPGVSPTPSPGMIPRLIIDSGDYNGDGRSEIAIFRKSTGLWSIRALTRIYFGSSTDTPVPGDFNGDGKADIGIFRSSSGLWAVRAVTRSYFGSAADIAVPGDYNGDYSCDIGIFRAATGLWAIRGVTRSYFGTSGDVVLPGDYNGDGTEDLGIFRATAGLWAIRGVTRIYFGGDGDTVVPGDYNGDGSWTVGIFRPASGLWAIRGITRTYFGAVSDQPVPGDYSGDTVDDIGIFRRQSGLWAVQGVTRVYYGATGDIPVTR